MDKDEYGNIFRNEKRHFYYRSVQDLILRLVSKYTNVAGVAADRQLAILDAGCGTGALAERMQRFARVSGIDMSDEALAICRQRGFEAVKSDIQTLPFDSNSFDVVTSVDVIYHRTVVDDVKALSELHRVLRPNGFIVMRVPAREELFSSHDKVVWSARRYTKEQLESRLIAAKFSIKQLTYCHFPLYLPVLVKTRLESMRAGGDSEHSAVSDISPVINAILENILKLENQVLLNGINLPIGLGLIAVAQKEV